MATAGSNRITVVEQGEQRRRQEAIHQLVEEITHGRIDGMSPIIRNALEVGQSLQHIPILS
jgi:hypothetical protein